MCFEKIWFGLDQIYFPRGGGSEFGAPTSTAEPTVVAMVVEHQVVVEQVVAAQEAPMGSVDAQILATKGASADMRDSLPPTSELSTGR